MRRRDFLAIASLPIVPSVLVARPANAKDDVEDGGSRRGRGSDDGPFDDRGGGSSSGHGSVDERAASFGDSRADRSGSRLREELREDSVRERDLERRSEERRRGRSEVEADFGSGAPIERANSQFAAEPRAAPGTESSNGVGRFLAELFGAPRDR